MIEDRFVVSDGLWMRLEPYLPGKASDSGVTAKDNRLFLEAVLRGVRTGSPWRKRRDPTKGEPQTPTGLRYTSLQVAASV